MKARFFIFLSLFFMTQYLFAKNPDMGENGFYITNDMTTYQSSDVQTLLDKLTTESPDKNILFYIHGRSRTLLKEWNNINTVEKTYNVRVLMLHWESWNSALDRPVENTLDGAIDLADGLREIHLYKANNASKFKEKKLLMLFHSMGNIVLMNMLKKTKNIIQDPNFFDSIILSGADTPFTGHRKWLESLNMSKNVFVVMNKMDGVLLASMAHDYLELNPWTKNDDRLGLGRGIENYLFFNFKLAQNARYFDITALSGNDHRHYLSANREVEDLFHFMFQERDEKVPDEGSGLPLQTFRVKSNFFKFK